MRECNKKRMSGAAVLPVVAFLLATAAGAGFAQAGEIFAGLEGAWSGEGAAKFSDGSSTPLRGQGFSAEASVVTRGARQSLAITTAGGGFASASIVLRRGR